jgi:hypothetical protein
VELFFNLVWAALSLALLLAWLLLKDSWNDDFLRHRVAVQFVALALLIIILLPVVSLTDDLQARMIPAESEHLSRRSDFRALADFTLHGISVALVGITAVLPSPRPITFSVLCLKADSVAPFEGYLRILGSRPPPAI